MKLTEKRNTFTPAALAALSVGNLANFHAAMTPGGIEAQEKRGQMEQSKKQTLPLDLGQRRDGNLEDTRAPWIALGFKFGKTVEDIFTECEFPSGWKKAPIDHSMWSDIVDDKGRKRGAIFYKAAFYDRKAHARLNCRFGVESDYGRPTETVRVTDACGLVEFKVSTPDWGGSRDQAEKRQAKIDEARAACAAYLKNNFPDFASPSAYWDAP